MASPGVGGLRGNVPHYPLVKVSLRNTRLSDGTVPNVPSHIIQIYPILPHFLRSILAPITVNPSPCHAHTIKLGTTLTQLPKGAGLWLPHVSRSLSRNSPGHQHKPFSWVPDIPSNRDIFSWLLFTCPASQTLSPSSLPPHQPTPTSASNPITPPKRLLPKAQTGSVSPKPVATFLSHLSRTLNGLPPC